MRRFATFLFAVAIAANALAAPPRRVRFSPSLPRLGSKSQPLPAGDGRRLVETSCLSCHASDILVQQRLTEKQWTAAVEKMIRWGAAVRDDDKPVMIAYLSRHFGPKNRFTPLRVRPD